MMKIIAIQIIAIFLVISPAIAVETDYAIHTDWYMVTCAGFGYLLEFDNYDGTFRLTLGDACGSVIRPVFKGKFRINKQSVILDFGEIKAYFYLKLPFSYECGGTSLTDKEQKLYCDKSQLLPGKTVLPGYGKEGEVYLSKPTLFPSKIEGSKNDKMIEQVISDLKTNCFVTKD